MPPPAKPPAARCGAAPRSLLRPRHRTLPRRRPWSPLRRCRRWPRSPPRRRPRIPPRRRPPLARCAAVPFPVAIFPLRLLLGPLSLLRHMNSNHSLRHQNFSHTISHGQRTSQSSALLSETRRTLHFISTLDSQTTRGYATGKAGLDLTRGYSDSNTPLSIFLQFHLGYITTRN